MRRSPVHADQFRYSTMITFSDSFPLCLQKEFILTLYNAFSFKEINESIKK